MATFTTWSDLKTQVLNDLASGNWRTSEYTTPIGTRSFHTLKDYTAFLAFIDQQVGVEAGTGVGRTYAKQGGGGRW